MRLEAEVIASEVAWLIGVNRVIDASNRNYMGSRRLTSERRVIFGEHSAKNSFIWASSVRFIAIRS